MYRELACACALVLVLGLGACGGSDAGDGKADVTVPVEKLAIYTTCFPVDWLTRRVAGDHAEVVHVLPVGEDPPEWTPPPETVTAMQGASLIITNGAGFEGWVATTTLPEARVIDTSDSPQIHLIEILEEATHSHGKDGEHTHKGIDPHTWSDPKTAVAQAAVIRDALSKADPAHADAFAASHEALAHDLRQLEEGYKAACKGYGGEVMATSHPAFNYLARHLGLRLIDFGFEPDAAPDEREMTRFRETVADEGITVLLWEAHPTDEVKAPFDEIGVMSVFLDPLEQPPDGGTYDYLAQARANVGTLEGLFGETAANAE